MRFHIEALILGKQDNLMSGIAVEFSYDTIIFMVLLGIILVLLSIIFINTQSVEDRAGFVGAPGVVRVDDIKLERKMLDNTHSAFVLTITNAVHEEGKDLKVVPVITTRSPDPAIEFLFRPESKDNVNENFPYYRIVSETEITGYFNMVYFNENIQGNTLHVSLWEEACLNQIGFVRNAPVGINYQQLVKKCSSSYLAAWQVEYEVNDII